MNMGVEIKEKRIAKNISKRRLAQIAGISSTWIDKIENGYEPKKQKHVIFAKILRAFDKIDDMYYEKSARQRLIYEDKLSNRLTIILKMMDDNYNRAKMRDVF
ncbi:MAG: helix-turn-helix transcriptional regulator [Candidatus Pacearchaeota archaeon]